MSDVVELPLHEDWTIYAGSTARKAWRWTRDGQPGVTSQWRGACQVRGAARGDSPVALDLSSENGGVQLTDDGLVILYATDEQTGAMVLPNGVGVFDVEVESPAGERFRFVMGDVDLSPEVTR